MAQADEAATSVQALIASGWLTGGQENLSPVDDFSSSVTPLDGIQDHSV